MRLSSVSFREIVSVTLQLSVLIISSLRSGGTQLFFITLSESFTQKENHPMEAEWKVCRGRTSQSERKLSMKVVNWFWTHPGNGQTDLSRP